jgi:hypothetical protein
MHIQFSHPATLDFRDVVMAMVPFVRYGGVSVVANSDGVFVTALTKDVDLKFRIPGATAICTGDVTVSIFALRDVLKKRTFTSAKKTPLALTLVGKTHVALSIGKRSWQLDRKTE